MPPPLSRLQALVQRTPRSTHLPLPPPRPTQVCCKCSHPNAIPRVNTHLTTCRGPAAAVLLCLLPIFFLLATTLLKPLALPSSTSLPLAAALLALIRLSYLSSPPLLVLAHTVVGALEGLVPLAVIFGAVLLFEAMAATGCLQWLMTSVRCLSAGSPIAEVFLIGWAFAYTISGGGGRRRWASGGLRGGERRQREEGE